MRLKSVKLAGFKSFIDSTTVAFRSNLTAIVGPNGSGKSNVIDAIRWVMGESSAKYLRGESMADVIFNGSTSRKPAAHASIELIFDNSEGKLGGQYASYEQIGVRREVTRDGQSNYFLNGTRCRRKDITDLFLGTGLGPRSYAIIMQDTISRLIEAKPEDLRIYLEEVAGISKYKERRRETELRMGHTRENLERLTDIRDELEKQINHLDRQAKAAEKFKELKQEERTTKAETLTLQWQGFDQQLQSQKQTILQFETQLDEAISEIRSIDASFERHREAQIESTEKVNEAQAHYYSIGAEIGRLEQAKQHRQERAQQLQEDYQQAVTNLEQSQSQLSQDQQQLTELQKNITALNPELEATQAQANSSQDSLLAAEEVLQQWQQQWDEFNQSSAASSQKEQVEKTRIQHLERRREEMQQRYEQLHSEQNNLKVAAEDQHIIQLQDRMLAKSQEQEQLQEEVEALRTNIQQERESLHQINQRLDQERASLQQSRGKYASLEALQQAALGQKDAKTLEWLREQQLISHPRLGEQVKVHSGWERAVETVLAHYLEAVCLDNIPAIAPALQSFTQGHLTLVANEITVNHNLVNHSLAEKVTASSVVKSLLANIAVAESLDEAFKSINALAPHQSLITKDGIWLGHGWLRLSYEHDEQTGILQRQNELTELKANISSLEQGIATLSHQQEIHKESLQHLETLRDDQQQLLRRTTAELAELQSQVKIQQARIAQQQQRAKELALTISQTQEHLHTTENDLSVARELLQEVIHHTEKDASIRQELLMARDQKRQDLETKRQQARDIKDKVHQLALKAQGLSTQITALTHNIQRTQQQLQHLVDRKQQLQIALDSADHPLTELNQQLELALEKQLQAEKVLTQTRQQLASVDHAIRELTEQRHDAEEKTESVRSLLEQKRMQLENVKVRRTTLEEQLQEMDFQLETVIQGMSADANETAWQEKLAALERRIQRLGPINLAAIDEFKEVSERKSYLDKQHADLIDALTTLETAINKIDKETRQKFKETYDAVNDNFRELFPKIFGGGSALLELTGEDLLETGVIVMARPPGKKNSHIHLLSGGEKALTALALVFSLFKINPAPFCLLDEVDAPLDDANIGRFCTLVKEMSKEIQFLFISHNKLAIEMADQLIGVTMREPGVSRLVAVDIEEAISGLA